MSSGNGYRPQLLPKDMNEGKIDGSSFLLNLVYTIPDAGNECFKFTFI